MFRLLTIILTMAFFTILIVTLLSTIATNNVFAHPHSHYHHYAPVRRYCSNSVKLAIGSYTFQPWLPTGKGQGVTIVKLTSTSLSKQYLISNVTRTGQNPAYCQKSSLCATSLYCVNEVGEGGSVTKFSTSLTKRTKFSSRPSEESSGSTHLSVFPKGGSEMIVTANYGGSSVSALYYDSYKRKLRLLDVDVIPKRFAARSAKPESGFHPQNDPHPHFVLSLTRRYFLVPDLGSDTIWLYKINQFGKLKRYNGIKLKFGDGPRHMVRGKGRNIYVLNELSNTVVRVNGCNRKFLSKECERKILLPNGGHKDDTQMSSAAIRLSADKRFLYASLRPDNQHGRIAVFALGDDGSIGKRVGVYTTHGEHPRDFYIVDGVGTECESYVVVANMNSNKIVAIKRNKKTGELHDDHPIHRLTINTPTSVLEL